MSLLAKVKYLVCNLHIKPEDILVISFTKKTVSELKERCAIAGVEIRTFHSLGHKLLCEAGIEGRLIKNSEFDGVIRTALAGIKEKHAEIFPNFDNLSRLVGSFLMLHKNDGRAIDELQFDESPRTRAFLEMYNIVSTHYADYSAKRQLYDFADMINLATNAVKTQPELANNYRYILLDEVQDLSKNRQLLIRAILDKNPDCRLFAVGDDWQSIYRFAGSDLELIRNFAKVFNRKTRVSFIESTHRFGKPTTKISSDFIQQNSLQVCKKVRAARKIRTPISIVYSEKVDDDSAAVERIINEIGVEKLAAKQLQIISRFNHDVGRLKSPNFRVRPIGNEVYEVIWRDVLRFEFCSMHKSKGITRDIVIVLNMSSRPAGMPASRPNDPLIEALLAPEEDFAFAEERRLFYVAITRAREQTFLIADAKHPSPFILEIM